LLLRKNEIDLNPKLSKKYVLNLNIESNQEGIERFLQEAKDLELPRIKGIIISPISFLSEEGTKDLDEFLTNSMPFALKTLTLKTIGSGIENITDGLKYALPIVRRQAIFENFILQQKDIELIFDS
jgi:hypothetical protein